MKQSVQIAHLVNGETLSVRILSPRNERRAAALSAFAVLSVTLTAGTLLALGLLAGHRIIHGPVFVALWGALGVALTLLAAARARRRAGHYTIGLDLDDDAFSPLPITLVRRRGQQYELAVAPGMSGIIEGAATASGQRTRPVDGMGRAHVALGDGVHAEIAIGKTTFAIRGLASEGARVALSPGFCRPHVRRALAPIQLAALATFFCTVPAGALLGEHDMRSAIPADSSPWEVEKLLRQEAQIQAATLYACFEPLPLSCQHPGYVGVGLSLARDGEIRTSWIARSTYGKECPVDACMSNVISSWFFEPLPESMRIVLPVQVLRTSKPLPEHLGLASVSARGGLN
ncbi:MAG: hypothetical protein JWM82_3114 [Myxococcales bacterium]|nr:hypothetical protein [Myxococcales bacterium]